MFTAESGITSLLPGDTSEFQRVLAPPLSVLASPSFQQESQSLQKACDL